MAFTPKTFADLKQSLADRHDSGTLPTDSATLAYWARLLNKARDYCADRLQLVKTTTLTTSSGVIALPDDFITVKEVVDADNQYWTLISKEQSEGATGNLYWVTGNQTDGFVLNTPEDVALTVYYTFRPEDMATDADVCIIPDGEAVVARAYGNLRMAETDPLEDAQTSLQECERRLDEVIYQRNLNDGSTNFILPVNA